MTFDDEGKAWAQSRESLIDMLPRHHLNRRCLLAPLPDAQGSGPGTAPARQATVLDPEALRRLRELDPTGSSKLMERVVRAFNNSLARLVPQLHEAQAQADSAGIRHVAHTLKSSSASVGAVKLSGLCAEMEVMARGGQTTGMDEKIAVLCTEISAVREALMHTLDRPA